MFVRKKKILVLIYEKNKAVLIGFKIRQNDSFFFKNQNQNKLIVMAFWTKF